MSQMINNVSRSFGEDVNQQTGWATETEVSLQ